MCSIQWKEFYSNCCWKELQYPLDYIIIYEDDLSPNPTRRKWNNISIYSPDFVCWGHPLDVVRRSVVYLLILEVKIYYFATSGDLLKNCYKNHPHSYLFWTYNYIITAEQSKINKHNLKYKIKKLMINDNPY